MIEPLSKNDSYKKSIQKIPFPLLTILNILSQNPGMRNHPIYGLNGNRKAFGYFWCSIAMVFAYIINHAFNFFNSRFKIHDQCFSFGKTLVTGNQAYFYAIFPT